MPVCDAHEAVHGEEKQMSSGGYLLEAGFIQNSAIQEKLLDRDVPTMESMGMSREEYRQQVNSIQGDSPWLICDECVGLLNLSEADKQAAAAAAERWWRDNSTPGHVPGQGAAGGPDPDEEPMDEGGFEEVDDEPSAEATSEPEQSGDERDQTPPKKEKRGVSEPMKLALTSLAAAIPAGVLTGLLVYSFLNHAENMTTMFKLLAGFTLLMSFLITVSPAGILLFTPKGEPGESEGEAEAEPAQAVADEPDAQQEPEAAEAEPDDEFGEFADDADFEPDAEAVEPPESDDEILGASDDEFADIDFDDFTDEKQ